jgi:hypothetical protein
MGFVSKNGLEIIPTDKRNHPKDFETKTINLFLINLSIMIKKNRFLISRKKKRPNHTN